MKTLDGILGFEPRLPRSERGVLPLDDIPEDAYCNLFKDILQEKVSLAFIPVHQTWEQLVLLT